MARQPPVGQDFLIIEASRSHLDTSHSLGLPWMSDQPDAENSTWQRTINTTDRHPWTVIFETESPASERPQTQALERTDTGVGLNKICCIYLIPFTEYQL